MAYAPLVSIVIPCYNYGTFLAEAVSSALSQTYPHIEVLVIDDGSTDTTGAIAALFGAAIGFYPKANGGLPSARNWGLARCKGSFVVFLDADDILVPTYVERLLRVFQKTDDPKLGFVYTQMEMFGTASGITDFPEFEAESLVEGNYVHATAMMPTAAIKGIRYDESLQFGWEDWNLYLDLIELGYYGKLVDEPLLKYRRHASPHRAFSNTNEEDVQHELYCQVKKRHPRLYGFREP